MQRAGSGPDARPLTQTWVPTYITSYHTYYIYVVSGLRAWTLTRREPTPWDPTKQFVKFGRWWTHTTTVCAPMFDLIRKRSQGASSRFPPFPIVGYIRIRENYGTLLCNRVTTFFAVGAVNLFAFIRSYSPLLLASIPPPRIHFFIHGSLVSSPDFELSLAVPKFEKPESESIIAVEKNMRKHKIFAGFRKQKHSCTVPKKMLKFKFYTELSNLKISKKNHPCSSSFAIFAIWAFLSTIAFIRFYLPKEYGGNSARSEFFS